MAKKRTPTVAEITGHPAYRNPNATSEQAADLQSICPHRGSVACGGSAVDPTAPTLVRYWTGCSDCGLVTHRTNYRLREATKAEIKRDRERFCRMDLDPANAAIWLAHGFITAEEAALAH